MLVPRTRLVVWTALVVPPFALLAAVEPAAAGVAVLIMLALGLLAIGDAIASRSRFGGLALEFPPFARLSQNRPGKLELKVRNQRQLRGHLRVALAMPAGIHSPEEVMELSLPQDSEWSRFNWRCQPTRRGRFALEHAHLETASPLGFWDVRKQVSAGTELRVYPDLLTERKDLAALFLNRGGLGLHTQRQIGKGREFEKLRDYLPGDSFEDVHWKATARRGRPITKVFQIERTQEVYVVIDSSRLSGRAGGNSKSEIRNPKEIRSAKFDSEAAPNEEVPPGGMEEAPRTTTLERFITAALVLGLAAERQGDLFGVLNFNDRVEQFVRARNGRAHFNTCREVLYHLQPKIVTPDFDEVFTFLRLRLRRRALVIFLTELDDPALAESFTQKLDLICRQHVVLVNTVQPAGVAPLFGQEVGSVDAVYGALGGHLRWWGLKEFERVLARRGVRFSLLQSEGLSAELVSQYLNVKRRQLL